MKRSDIKESDKWTFYEATLDNVRFEWPDPFNNGDESAMKDCKVYLDQIFEGKYTIKSFRKKGES